MSRVVLLLLFLSACATSTTIENLSTRQEKVAHAMEIDFYIPAPIFVDAFDLHSDGRTLARTLCIPHLNSVVGLQYRTDVDRERNEAIIAHELQHAIQCHTGKWRSMTSSEREKEAEAIESWWRSRQRVEDT